GVHGDAHVVGLAGRVGPAVGAAVAAAFVAVLHLLRRAVVAGRDDAVAADQDGADLVAAAVGARADRHGDAHVVLGPFRPLAGGCDGRGHHASSRASASGANVSGAVSPPPGSESTVAVSGGGSSQTESAISQVTAG